MTPNTIAIVNTFIKFLKAHTVFLPVAVTFNLHQLMHEVAYCNFSGVWKMNAPFQPQGANKNDCSLKKKWEFNLHVLVMAKRGYYYFN